MRPESPRAIAGPSPPLCGAGVLKFFLPVATSPHLADREEAIRNHQVLKEIHCTVRRTAGVVTVQQRRGHVEVDRCLAPRLGRGVSALGQQRALPRPLASGAQFVDGRPKVRAAVPASRRPEGEVVDTVERSVRTPWAASSPISGRPRAGCRKPPQAQQAGAALWAFPSAPISAGKSEPMNVVLYAPVRQADRVHRRGPPVPYGPQAAPLPPEQAGLGLSEARLPPNRALCLRMQTISLPRDAPEWRSPVCPTLPTSSVAAPRNHPNDKSAWV